MEQKKIDRINELAHLAKERELSEAEQQERTKLRREYIDSMKASLANHLDNTVVLYPDGSRKRLKTK